MNAHAICLYPIGNSNVPESSAVTMETNLSLKNHVSKKKLVFFTDLMTLKINIK